MRGPSLAAERARDLAVGRVAALRAAGLHREADDLADVLPALVTFDRIERDVLQRALLRIGAAPKEASEAIRLCLAPDLPQLRRAVVDRLAAIGVPADETATNDKAVRLAKKLAFLRCSGKGGPLVDEALEAVRALAAALDCAGRIDTAIAAEEAACRRRGIGVEARS